MALEFYLIFNAMCVLHYTHDRCYTYRYLDERSVADLRIGE